VSYPPQPPPTQPHGSNPPPPPGYPMPVTAPAKKSNKKLIFGIIGGLFGLCCVGGAIAAATSNDDKPKAAATTNPVVRKTTKGANTANAAPVKPVPTQQVAQGPGLGDKVRDGKFEFVVKSVSCGKSKIGSKYLNKKAQGQFCEITVTVKNIGDESQTFDGSSQTAFAGDIEYSDDSEAEMYADGDSNTFLNEINPGNQTTGKLIFDVPKSTKLTSLELHDSTFSGGVKVALK
jgi:hypothetical protein